MRNRRGGPGVTWGGADTGVGEIAEGERDSARTVLCGKWGREQSGAYGKVSLIPIEQIDEGFCLRETKNDDTRAIPIVPALRVLLRAQFARRQPDCPYVCFRVDRSERSDKIKSFRKSWHSACVKTGLGEMVPSVNTAGKPVYAPLRGPRSRQSK
jgi:hypothetical protein